MKKILIVSGISLFVIGLCSIGVFAKGNDYNCLDMHNGYNYNNCLEYHNCLNTEKHTHHSYYKHHAHHAKGHHNCQ